LLAAPRSQNSNVGIGTSTSFAGANWILALIFCGLRDARSDLDAPMKAPILTDGSTFVSTHEFFMFPQKKFINFLDPASNSSGAFLILEIVRAALM